MTSAKEILRQIEHAKRILILPHVNPDGDATSSVIALGKIININFKDKEVTVAGELRQNNNAMFLNGFKEIKSFDKIEGNEFDLIIAVDVAAKDRLGDGLPFFEKCSETVNIDHHKTNNNFAKENYVKPELCSAGAVLCEFIEETGLEINKDIAEALYTSILSDTGGFKYSNTTAYTLQKASELLRYGVNPSEVYAKLFESSTKEQVLFSAKIISEAKFAFNNKVAYGIITLDDMKKLNALKEHTETVVETLRKIKTTEVAFTVKETENGFTKVSFRSKNVDVSKIAAIFDGGGHEKAAGCIIKKPYLTACNKILEYLEHAI